ncbi:hypothetical protein BGZ73_006227 [Actinomortierella ambigua]|nr:hypothetical protein BGZ73_006227 [Actinomortierella ambigua]
MSNPLFDDFLELDMLDMSTSPSTGADMYPFLFNAGTELDSTLDPVTAAAMSLLDDPLATGSPLSLNIDMDQHEEPKQQAHEQQPQQQQELLEEKKGEEAKLDPSLLAIATAAAGSLGTNVNPSQLLLTPPAEPLTMSPTTATTSLFAPATTVATTASNTKTDPSAARSAKRPRSNSLEPSAELMQAVPVPTKAPSTATSKSSTTSSRKSSASSSASPAVSSAKSTTASTATTKASSASTENEDTASLTSTTNTTLSAATLQFLLEQQAQAPLVPQLFSGTLTREEIDATLAQLLESTKHLLQPDTPLASATPGGAGSSSMDSPLAKVKEEMSDDEMEDMEGLEQNGQQQSTHGLKTQPGIKTDDIPSPTDLKKMTSKERRQLRNKISARNFRVRRKEYISTLEGQVQQHKTEARHLREAVTLVQDENLRLKKELEEVKRQLADTNISNALVAAAAAASVNLATPVASSTASSTTTAATSTTASTASTPTVSSSASTPSANTASTASNATTPATTTAATTTATTATTAATEAASTVVVSPTPLSKENQSLLSAIMSKGVTNALHPNAKANITLSLARPQSPILLPNYHKDVPNSTSAAGQGSSWKDKNPILVHRTLIPEVYFTDGFELSDKPQSMAANSAEELASRPWMQLCQEVVEEKKTVEKFESADDNKAKQDQLQQEQVAHAQTEMAPHLDGMAVLYELMQTCAWTMWMGSTMGDYDGSSWLLPEVEEANGEEQEEQEQQDEEDEARALVMSYEDVNLQPQGEDSQMLEWLYESLMARLVEMDLQQTQQQQQQQQYQHAAGSSTAAMV